MGRVVEECGKLLEKMQMFWESEDMAAGRAQADGKILGPLICEYCSTLKRLEKYVERDVAGYLTIRRARYAVTESMAGWIEPQVLYGWMVRNVCEVEAEELERLR